MDDLRKHDVLLFPIACLSIWLPVGVLYACLLSDSAEPSFIAGIPVAVVGLAEWIPFAVLVWRISCVSRTEKLLRPLLVLAGAAGVITPVALCQSQACGLAGIWQCIWCVLLLVCTGLVKDDRISAVAEGLSAVAGVPVMVCAFMQACA